MSKGTLYLIPNTLGPGPAEMVIPAGVLERSRSLQHFLAENEKTARRYLKSIGTPIALDDLRFHVLDKRTAPEEVSALCQPLLSGTDMGLISEAGLPAIADPGAAAVAWCHRNKVAVVPATGPSSIILALSASGFNGQQFAFHGYLPIERKDRQTVLRAMEHEVQRTGATQLFMETPFRNEKLLASIMEVCQPNTYLSIACDLTLAHAYIRTYTVAEWRKQRPKLHKRPCIFSMGRPAL